MQKNTKKMRQSSNTIGLILIFIGLMMGLTFFGWFFTLNDIFAITGVIGVIIFIIGLSIIK